MKKLCSLICCLLTTVTTISQEFGTGLKFDEKLYEEVPQSVPLVTRSFKALPASYSLKGYAPTPGNQGSQGSCVGWASAYGARTISNAIKNNWEYNTAKINQNTFSPAFVYNQIKVNAKCEGAYIENAMRVMNSSGSAKLSDFPYDYRSCLKNPDNYTFAKAKDHKILTYEKLARWNNPENLTGKVKKAISSKNPVVIGLFKFKSLQTDYNNVWIPNTGTYGHAMVVVGYDDNKAGGAFEIMNSWGTKFGKNGFFWIKYSDFERQVKTAYVLVDKEENKNNNFYNNDAYAYNKLGGELTLKLSNGSMMPVSLSDGATRNFNIVKATKTTYKVNETYSSGTQFRIYLNSKQRGYVYLIGYGSSDKSVNKLYPFANFSDYFNYTNSEIAIPNEDYFIEFDNNPGQDILCVLYSKEKLNINNIVNNAKFGSGDFVSRIKQALSNKMFSGNNISFSKDKISFEATSKSSLAKVVPIFISMNHQ
ncbi:C1 family peptidase [Polaribacter aestuariivivens]|uniref:C1 family peptidase n=1 Tax=Polaribacter aestuariivivens TaxID=2304626 RepID=UPI003F49538D